MIRPLDNDNELMVLVKLELLRVPPATLREEKAERIWEAPMERLPEFTFMLAAAREPFNCRTPLAMDSEPEKVFAPESVNWAGPAFVRALVPLRMPLMKTALSMERMESAERTPGPVNVRVPEVEGLPRATLPARANALEKVRAVVESLEMRPPKMESVPEPKALLLPASSEPAVSNTPPAKVLDPEMTNAEEPLLMTRPSVLAIMPLKVVFEEPLSVRVLPPVPKLRAPAPAMDAISREALIKRDAPEETVTALETARALPP